MSLTIPEDKVNSMASNATTKLNAGLLELRRLFLVENMLDSVKFGLSLWVLTYIGSWFNAMTLVMMVWVGIFTIPKVRFVLSIIKIWPLFVTTFIFETWSSLDTWFFCHGDLKYLNFFLSFVSFKQLQKNLKFQVNFI